MRSLPNYFKCKDCGAEIRSMSVRRFLVLLRLCDDCFETRKRLVTARESGTVTPDEFAGCQKALARHNGKGRAYIENLLQQPTEGGEG